MIVLRITNDKESISVPFSNIGWIKVKPTGTEGKQRELTIQFIPKGDCFFFLSENDSAILYAKLIGLQRDCNVQQEVGFEVYALRIVDGWYKSFDKIK